MTNLEQKIYNDISSCNEFHYSKSSSDKMLEINAIDNLISKGLIVKTSETLSYINGYVI